MFSTAVTTLKWFYRENDLLSLKTIGARRSLTRSATQKKSPPTQPAVRRTLLQEVDQRQGIDLCGDLQAGLVEVHLLLQAYHGGGGVR